MTNKLFKDIVTIIIIIFLLFNFKVTLNIFCNFVKLVNPFIIGIVVAFILNVIMNKIEKIYKVFFKKSKIMRPICLFITLLIVFIVIVLMYLLVVPQVIESINIINNDLDSYISKLSDCLIKFGLNSNDVDNIILYVSNEKNKILNFVCLDNLKNVDYFFCMMGIISNIMVNFIIGFVFAIYVLLQKEKLRLQLKKIMRVYLSEENNYKIIKIGNISNKIFSNFVGGQFLESVILGMLCFIGMLVLKIPYAVVVSLIITITALIPMFGALIGTVIGVLFILIVDPLKAFTFVIYIIILQQIEGNFIYPKVVGKTVGLPGIWVIVAVSLGYALFGIIGMVLFVPVFSVIYSLIASDVNNKLKALK